MATDAQVIKKVVRGKVTPSQRRRRVAEWKEITPETQQILDRLDNARAAREFLRKNSQRLGRLPDPKSSLAEIPDPIRIVDLRLPERLICRILCAIRRYRVRKNQANLSATEWARFLGAINALMQSGIPVPTYQDFVDVHVQAMTTTVGMSWGAHGSSNFLPWHRDYLFALESRLRLFNPLVTIPYWDWSNNPSLPAPLTDPIAMAAWGITRNSSITNLPTPVQVTNTLAQTTWNNFRTSLEGIHNAVHGRVGGNMGGAGSPQDPVFWLHHAFVDKIWADWQKINTGAAASPSNLSDTLQPPPLITRTVAQTMSTTSMGYVYV